MKRTLPLMILCICVTACDLERGDTDWPEQMPVDMSIPDTGEDAGLGEGPGAGTMSGTWLMLHEGSTCVLGDEQLTHAWYLISMEQTGRTVHETRRLCRLDLSPVLGLKVVIPDATREAVTFVEVEPGLISDLRVGGSYTSSAELALWGVDLETPISDALPDSVDDPRVIDSDGDGNPAVTFAIDGSSCLRFAGQRQVIRYFGELETPNAIGGSSINITDVKAYGSTEILCGIAPPLVSNDKHSRFRMVRIDGLGGSTNADQNDDDEVSCEEASPYFSGVMERRAANREFCKR